MSEEDYRKRLYDAYATTHAGVGDDKVSGIIYERDIRPHLPSDRHAKVLDIGCGQGQLVSQLTSDGYLAAGGIDISPEQVAIAHEAGVAAVELGDFQQVLQVRPKSYAAILAFDLLEHLTKTEVFRTFDHTYGALSEGGVFIARVPNAVSPFGGNFRYGDFTHETSFTPRSVTQLARATGFAEVLIYSSRPVAHGPKSAARSVFWRVFESFYKLSIATETGQRQGVIVTQNLIMVARKVSAT